MVAGFDDIVNTLKLVPELDSEMRFLHLPITTRTDYEAGIYPRIQAWYSYVHDSAANHKIGEYLLVIRDQMLEVLPPGDFWIKAMDDFIEINHRFYTGGKSDYWRNMNMRDEHKKAGIQQHGNLD